MILHITAYHAGFQVTSWSAITISSFPTLLLIWHPTPEMKCLSMLSY